VPNSCPRWPHLGLCATRLSFDAGAKGTHGCDTCEAETSARLARCGASPAPSERTRVGVEEFLRCTACGETKSFTKFRIRDPRGAQECRSCEDTRKLREAMERRRAEVANGR
jgi:hypothetical protein